MRTSEELVGVNLPDGKTKDFGQSIVKYLSVIQSIVEPKQGRSCIFGIKWSWKRLAQSKSADKVRAQKSNTYEQQKAFFSV